MVANFPHRPRINERNIRLWDTRAVKAEVRNKNTWLWQYIFTFEGRNCRHSLSPREKFQCVIFAKLFLRIIKKKTLKIIWKKIQDTRNFVTINYEGFLKKIMDNDKIYQKAIKFSEMYINILYWFYADELFNFVEINLLESWMKNCSKSNFERRSHMFNLFHLLRITFSFLIITRLLKVNAYIFQLFDVPTIYQATVYINKSFISINIQRFSI